MDKTDLIKLFHDSVLLSKDTKIQKLRKCPTKLLYLKILEYIARWFEKPIRVRAKTFWNESMYVVIPEVVSLNIYRCGFYEEGLTRMVLAHLRSGMVFFDIGAHFGYFSLLASAVVGNSGQVHSFEPTPDTFNILKANVSHKRNVFVNGCAVMDRKRTVFINNYGIKYSAFNSIYKGRLPEEILSKLKSERYEIKSITIDAYVENNEIKPNFVKIDAEGSEYEILLGMEKTISRFHPTISLEVGDFGVRENLTSSTIVNFLVAAGYQPYEYKDRKILQHNPKNAQYQYDNILFVYK